MENEKYELLLKDSNIKDDGEKYKTVNENIDEILSQTPNKMQTLEALICAYEAKCNIGAYFSASAIAYAVFIGAVAILPEGWIRMFAALLLLATSLVLAGLSAKIDKKYKQRIYVLCALRIRYEKMKSNSYSATHEDDEICEE